MTIATDATVADAVRLSLGSIVVAAVVGVFESGDKNYRTPLRSDSIERDVSPTEYCVFTTTSFSNSTRSEQ